jgi:hypothetical protein
MPSSKKGRLSGAARKELNSARCADIINAHFDAKAKKKGVVLDTTFARVTKHLGINHVHVAIPGEHGATELRARIPNIFTRKGATPISTRSIVAVYVGTEFDAKTYVAGRSDIFDIVGVLDAKEVARLTKAEIIPEWMSRSEDVAAAAAGGLEEDLGFVFEEEDAEDEDDAGKAAGGAGTGGGGGSAAASRGFSRSGARMAAIGGGGSDDDIDIDRI